MLKLGLWAPSISILPATQHAFGYIRACGRGALGRAADGANVLILPAGGKMSFCPRGKKILSREYFVSTAWRIFCAVKWSLFMRCTNHIACRPPWLIPPCERARGAAWRRAAMLAVSKFGC
jgi:hypothetical protein